MSKHKVKMSKASFKLQFFVGIFFVFWGLFFIFNMLRGQFLPGVIFSIVWTSIAGVQTFQAYKGAFTDQGMNYFEIESENSDEGLTLDFEERLRKLENLKNDGLITDTEYQEKRNEIMGEKW